MMEVRPFPFQNILLVFMSPSNFQDAATAEISRVQLWHWCHHGASTTDGTKITVPYVDKILSEEIVHVKKTGLDAKRVDISAAYLREQIRNKTLSDFLTTDLTCVIPLGLVGRYRD